MAATRTTESPRRVPPKREKMRAGSPISLDDISAGKRRTKNEAGHPGRPRARWGTFAMRMLLALLIVAGTYWNVRTKFAEAERLKTAAV